MLAAGWAAVTLVATLVAWRGVTVVADEVTESRPSSLSDDEVAQGAGDTTTSTAPAQTSSTTATTTSGSPAPPGPQPSAPGNPATPAPTAAPTTSPPATAPPPSPPAPSSETRTFDLVGGTVVVQFHGNGTVGLVSSQPKPGFERELHDAGPEKIDVEFESETHKSRLVARWEAGSPRGDVQEEADGGGDD